MKSLNFNQNEAVDKLIRWKVGALFMEAGTGKTRVAVEIARRSPCSCVIWVGPIRTLQNTMAEVDKWGGFGMEAIYYGIESIQQSDRIYLGFLETIRDAVNPFLIVDESLKIKNIEAKRTKRMMEAGKLAQYKLILNGTPFSRNILDVWSQMQFLSPLILNMTYSRYKDTFCKYTTVTKRMGSRCSTKEFITGYSNIDYLYSLIRHYIYKCDLSMNITQSYHDVRYTVDEQHREEYGRLKKYFIDQETLLWKNNNIFLEMTQKMQNAYCVCPSKFKAVDAILERLDHKKVIIFCKFIISREACQKRYPEVLVLSYQKESLGLNLQDYRYIIYFDKVWDYATRIQSSRRTYRTGQEFDCEYWDITSDLGLDSMIDRNITKKVSMTEYFKHKTKEEIEKEL